MTPTITIPTTALAMLQLPGYIARYQHYLGEGKSCPQAWEAVEAELFGYFEVNRYKNFETFKAILTRRASKKNQKTVTPKPLHL